MTNETVASVAALLHYVPKKLFIIFAWHKINGVQLSYYTIKQPNKQTAHVTFIFVKHSDRHRGGPD